VIPFLLGAVVGIAFVIGARSQRADRANLIYVVGLVITALLYVVFAISGRASGSSLGLELLGAILYCGLAVAGLRGGRTALALGWAGHPLWDVLLHTSGSGAAYTPSWYPMACVGFDLVVAVGILMQSSAGNISKPTE
jgi:hypothetical protein